MVAKFTNAIMRGNPDKFISERRTNMKKLGIIGTIVGGVALLAAGAVALVLNNKKDDETALLEEGELEVEYEDISDSVEEAE